jgi:hypothetical protein
MPLKISEESLDYLEEHIPELADAAVTQAYWQALASGSSVLEARDGALVEVLPDGSQKTIKPLPPQTKVTPGQVLQRR